MRPLGDVLLDMEVLVDEMIDDHDLQWGDILSLLHGHLLVHNPDSRENYEDGGHPEFYYGPSKVKENYVIDVETSGLSDRRDDLIRIINDHSEKKRRKSSKKL